MAAVKALVHEGSARIDPYHWETRDKSWFEGHFYSVKAPGLPFLTAPLYAGIDAVGGRPAGRARGRDSPTATATAAGTTTRSRSTATATRRARRDRVQATLERESPIVWALGLLGTVAAGRAPAARRALVRRADRARVRDDRRRDPRRRNPDPALRDPVLRARARGGARLRGVRPADARARGTAAAPRAVAVAGLLRGPRRDGRVPGGLRRRRRRLLRDRPRGMGAPRGRVLGGRDRRRAARRRSTTCGRSGP